MERQFEEINPSVWKPANEKDFVEGFLIGKEENIGVNKSSLYHLENGKAQIRVWGSKVLDDRMRFCNVGDFIKITYERTTKNSRGQSLKIFKVEKAKTEIDTPEQPKRRM